ncbi:MAG: hypothetical protein E2P02_29805 [Acidobacteria bacterium]|nr:MAG: hypothetical protein E2P02_29805 [Acidobacteriota bacterium]
MNGVTQNSASEARGFSVIEILIALVITMVVMASVFMLLRKGQDSFEREPEVTDMTASARAGLMRVSQDLMVAGFNTPANMAVMWLDGGGKNPDELTIVYADPEIPVSRPVSCVSNDGMLCDTIGASTVLQIDAASFSPMPLVMESAYQEGMTLFALQGPNGDPACDHVEPGITRFEILAPPKCTGAGGATTTANHCGTLSLKHSPSEAAALHATDIFQHDVSLACAVVGRFHIAQYRVNPLPPADSPTLERRDLALSEEWIPVSSNIENLQLQYAQGMSQLYEDEPSLVPMGHDPESFITRVRVSVSGRSASTNLPGGSPGVFAAEDTYLRKTFVTTVSLRNQLGQARQKAIELGLDGWN